jgi:hypothetical protein
MILGRVPIDDINPNIMTDAKKRLLKKLGIKNYDISHYKSGKHHLISKTKLNVLKTVMAAELYTSDKFVPLNSSKIKQQEKYLVIKGF